MFVFDGFVTGDGECVCEFCTDGKDEPLSGEFDAPVHCSYCGRPLECSLTAHGAAYVFRAMREEMAVLRRLSRKARHKPAAWPEGHYYHGLPRYAVIADWTEQLEAWNLTCWEKKQIERFRALCKPVEKGEKKAA